MAMLLLAHGGLLASLTNLTHGRGSPFWKEGRAPYIVHCSTRQHKNKKHNGGDIVTSPRHALCFDSTRLGRTLFIQLGASIVTARRENGCRAADVAIGGSRARCAR